mmetsp:Transcript_29529/g.81121  ORF Transcript_29529/g.81121 Transcript_29529/m.81121 type:complete len:352 (-) Transcript_29529:484-1539(-)
MGKEGKVNGSVDRSRVHSHGSPSTTSKKAGHPQTTAHVRAAYTATLVTAAAQRSQPLMSLCAVSPASLRGASFGGLGSKPTVQKARTKSAFRATRVRSTNTQPTAVRSASSGSARALEPARRAAAASEPTPRPSGPRPARRSASMRKPAAVPKIMPQSSQFCRKVGVAGRGRGCRTSTTARRRSRHEFAWGAVRSHLSTCSHKARGHWATSAMKRPWRRPAFTSKGECTPRYSRPKAMEKTHAPARSSMAPTPVALGAVGLWRRRYSTVKSELLTEFMAWVDGKPKSRQAVVSTSCTVLGIQTFGSKCFGRGSWKTSFNRFPQTRPPDTTKKICRAKRESMFQCSTGRESK